MLNSKGRVTECFFVRADGTHIEYELATDPPEAAFWSTYKLKPGHIKVVGKYDRKIKTELAKEICNDINCREAKVTKQPIENKILKKRQAARAKHAKTGQKQQKTG